MTYRLSKKTRISSILLSLTLLLICAGSAFLLLSTELKKTEASRSLIIICALIIFAATVYVIYTGIKDARAFITLDKEKGITYCNGIKTIQIKFKLIEQLNTTTGAFYYLTLKNEHLHHNLVNFSEFENKSEISSFLIDNVTDRFGRLKFKTEQMIRQEIDAENFTDDTTNESDKNFSNSTEEKLSGISQKSNDSVKKETAKVLSKNSGILGIKTIFVIFDIIANLTVFLALTKESKFLCILYIALLFVYPVYSFFSKSRSFDDLFGHCCMLFLVSAIFASIMFGSLIYRKTFLLIAALPTVIFSLIFIFILPKKNAKTEAERIINSVGADYSTLFARRVLIALLMSCIPLLLVNHIFDNQKEIVQQVSPFMQNEKYYAEVQIEKDGISEKLVFKLNTGSKGVNIKKPVYYRYRKGFLKMPTVLFFNKENHK